MQIANNTFSRIITVDIQKKSKGKNEILHLAPKQKYEIETTNPNDLIYKISVFADNQEVCRLKYAHPKTFLGCVQTQRSALKLHGSIDRVQEYVKTKACFSIDSKGVSVDYKKVSSTELYDFNSIYGQSHYFRIPSVVKPIQELVNKSEILNECETLDTAFEAFVKSADQKLNENLLLPLIPREEFYKYFSTFY